ncbi:hypothetical protein TIFTF001_029635 [Ficus carica]|uniref:Uncharacterized protein n=1 Tax=Ficus carica TaxID=3494 RepID=A0AA88IYC3_FICCA|nr:hypothetical protein TIFTF001_029635 [Ficus carica]
MPTRVWLEVYFKKNPKPTTGGTRVGPPNLVCSGRPHHPRGPWTIRKNEKLARLLDHHYVIGHLSNPDHFTLFTVADYRAITVADQFNPVKLGMAKANFSVSRHFFTSATSPVTLSSIWLKWLWATALPENARQSTLLKWDALPEYGRPEPREGRTRPHSLCQNLGPPDMSYYHHPPWKTSVVAKQPSPGHRAFSPTLPLVGSANKRNTLTSDPSTSYGKL